MLPATSPGKAKGKLIRQKTVPSAAPKVFAARKRVASICSKAPNAVRYIKGKATTVAVMTAAYQVKTILIFSSSNSFPKTPFFPNNKSNKKPTTVGGKIKGATKIPSIKDFALPRYPHIQ